MTDDPKLTFQGTYSGIVTVVTHLLSFFSMPGWWVFATAPMAAFQSKDFSMRQNVSMVSLS